MNAVVHIQGKLIWKYGRTKSGRYIAICDPIGQTVQADNFSDLLATMDEVLGSTLRELVSTNDFERFLKERGWTHQAEPKVFRQPNLRFDLPFDLKGVGIRDLEEALC